VPGARGGRRGRPAPNHSGRTIWETDDPGWDEVEREWADIWRPLPKVVFSTTLDTVEGNARLAGRDVAGELRSALAARSRMVRSLVCQRVSSLIAAMRQRPSQRRRPNR
jgi:hypothetical protein